MKKVFTLLLALSFLSACGSTSVTDGEKSVKTNKKTCIEKKTTGRRLAKKICKS
jgi:hypothetical protein